MSEGIRRMCGWGGDVPRPLGVVLRCGSPLQGGGLAVGDTEDSLMLCGWCGVGTYRALDLSSSDALCGDVLRTNYVREITHRTPRTSVAVNRSTPHVLKHTYRCCMGSHRGMGVVCSNLPAYTVYLIERPSLD